MKSNKNNTLKLPCPKCAKDVTAVKKMYGVVICSECSQILYSDHPPYTKYNNE